MPCSSRCPALQLSCPPAARHACRAKSNDRGSHPGATITADGRLSCRGKLLSLQAYQERCVGRSSALPLRCVFVEDVDQCLKVGAGRGAPAPALRLHGRSLAPRRLAAPRSCPWPERLRSACSCRTPRPHLHLNPHLCAPPRRRHQELLNLATSSEIDAALWYCVLCTEGGRLMCCDGCPRTFHTKCLRMKRAPAGEWFCRACRVQRVGGAGAVLACAVPVLRAGPVRPGAEGARA
jgi:hypothetical protein